MYQRIPSKPQHETWLEGPAILSGQGMLVMESNALLLVMLIEKNSRFTVMLENLEIAAGLNHVVSTCNLYLSARSSKHRDVEGCSVAVGRGGTKVNGRGSLWHKHGTIKTASFDDRFPQITPGLAAALNIALKPRALDLQLRAQEQPQGLALHTLS